MKVRKFFTGLLFLMICFFAMGAESIIDMIFKACGL